MKNKVFIIYSDYGWHEIYIYGVANSIEGKCAIMEECMQHCICDNLKVKEIELNTFCKNF